MTDASESIDVDTHQASNICVINNPGKNAGQHERGRFVQGKRGRLSSRQPVSRQSWGRGGRYNRAFHSVSEESDNMQMCQNTDSSLTATAESSHTHCAVSPSSSFSLMSDHDAARRNQSEGRGKRRPWRAKGTDRPCSDYSRTRQVKDCSLSSHVASTAELELVSNAETDEWVDDDDDDDDVFKARLLPVAVRGKHKNWNARARGVHDNRRGHSRSCDALECENMLISQETVAAESRADAKPTESCVREAVVKQRTIPVCDKSGRHQKNSKQRSVSSSSHQLCEMVNNARVSASTNNGSDSAVKTPIASDMKQVDVDGHRKNSSFKSFTRTCIDENSLFWHLVNEHSGKCCIDELKNELNTNDADNAIAILRQLKRIKILVNESDKWLSVAFVFLKGLRLCLHVKAGCRNKNCSFLHICPDYITESCLAGQQCCFGHNVRTPCNESCLQKCGIPNSCSSESILTIVRCSNPIICAGHNGVRESRCRNPVQCIRFHVCNYFFYDHCLIPNSKCILGHELRNEHNARLLHLYEVGHLLKDEKSKTLHQMILPFNIARSVTHTSYENFRKSSQMIAAQQTSTPCTSDLVAVVSPNVRTGVKFQMAKREVKDAALPSVISDSHPSFTAPATEPSSIHQAKRPVTLNKFVISPDLTSKTNVVDEDEDKHASCSSSVSTEQPNADDRTASRQSSEVEITEDSADLLVSIESDSHMESMQVSETAQQNAVHRFATRRSQSTKTLELRPNQCQVYMKHLCNESNECSVRHDSLPYLWRVQDSGKWVAFDDSVCIEQAFCSPDNSTYATSYQVRIVCCKLVTVA